MEQPVPRLSRGERAPDFILPSLDGTPTRFYAKAGGTPTLLILVTLTGLMKYYVSQKNLKTKILTCNFHF